MTSDEQADRLREIAEQYLYDGDTDQPVNAGYLALLDVADRLAASRSSSPATSGLESDGLSFKPDRSTLNPSPTTEAVTEPETRRWLPWTREDPGPAGRELVEWIKELGGEARYERAHNDSSFCVCGSEARIVITGPSGLVVMHPGDEAVKGERWFFLCPVECRGGHDECLRRKFTVRPASPEGAS